MQDEHPSIYVLEQSFRVGNDWLIRRGFISALMMEELGEGSIHPHENTMSSPKSDRFKLMKSCRAKLSPIMSIYSDPEGNIDSLVRSFRSGDPEYSFTDDDGIAYRFWPITDSSSIADLVEQVAQQDMVIADGHHRYESSLSFARKNRDSDKKWGEAPEDYIVSLCISVSNSGLLTLPTHRRVRSNGSFDLDQALARIEQSFDLLPAGKVNAEMAGDEFDRQRGDRELVGCLLPDGDMYLLSPSDEQDLRGRFPADADSWWNLPVSLLHHVILADLLGLDPYAGANSDSIDFHHDAQKIADGVLSGDFNMGFFLPATDPASVQRIASRGQRLPQKSTFFYPKVASGLVLYPHANETVPSRNPF